MTVLCNYHSQNVDSLLELCLRALNQRTPLHSSERTRYSGGKELTTQNLVDSYFCVSLLPEDMTSADDAIGLFIGIVMIVVILAAFLPVYQDIFGWGLGVIIIIVIGIIGILAALGEMT